MHRISTLIFLAAAVCAGSSNGAPPEGAPSEGAPSEGAPSEGAPPEGAPSETQPTGPTDAEITAFTSEDSGMLSIKVDPEGLMEMTEDRSSFAASGNVRIAWRDTIVTADHALAWPLKNEMYVEGNVRMLTPSREIRCERAFISWASGEVVFDQLKLRSRDKTKPLAWYVDTPLGVRLSNGTILAKKAKVSTCDYAVPHHYLRVGEVIIKPNNDIIVKRVTYHVRGVPTPFYVPVMIVPGSRPAVDARFGNTSDFGTFATLDTSFGLPVGFDATGTVALGYYSKRGPGWGLGLDYDTPTITRGEAEYYAIPHDAGQDFDDQILGKDYRYRYRWLHSADSPRGWELDIELHKYSDAGFRKEFFESEYYKDKDVENRIYVKRAEDNWAAFIEGKLRLNEHLDQTERLPVAGIRGFSQPLRNGLLWTSDTEFGFLRRRLSEIRRRPGESDADYNARIQKWNVFQKPLAITADEALGEDRTVFRFDTAHTISRPFALNRLKLEPFVGVRGTYYEETLRGNTSTWRNQLLYGGRVSTMLHRYFDVTSEALNIDGIRHIILPDISYTAKTDTWGADPSELIQFDETDAITQEDYITLRLRNRFQTRRRGKTIDLLDLGIETDYYPHSRRDNNAEGFSPLRIDAISHPVDGLTLLLNADYDFSENDRGPAFLNLGASVAVSERWSAYAGHTYERDIDNFGTYSLAYDLTPKWTAVASYDRDWRNGQALEERLELLRDFHAFSLAIVLENDERSGEQSVGFAISPKGIKMPPRPGSFARHLPEARDNTE